jgi:hypothetical protein
MLVCAKWETIASLRFSFPLGYRRRESRAMLRVGRK